jgi:hypothetical protein
MQPSDDRDLAQTENRILEAINLLLKHDGYLFTCDLNERSITHKFAEHLQRAFPEWNVDCEYNRNHDDPKRLNLPARNDISSDDLHAKTVFPDIIIHHRGTDDNFVVIEVKKSSNPEGDEWDMTKLAAFKRQLGYKIAMFVRFRTGTGNLGFEYNIQRGE